MTLVPRPSSLSGSPGVDRVEFDLSEFKRLITGQGYDAVWSKALLCPNRDPLQDDHHYIDCTICDKGGFVYFDPIQIKVLATAFSTRFAFMPESRYEPGTSYFTTLPEYKLNFWDKIVMLTSEARFSQVVKLLPNISTYQLKYPVLSVVSAVANTGETIEPETFTVEPDGRVTFTPQYGWTFVAIAFMYHPTYIVIDLPHHVRDSRVTVVGEDKQLFFPVQATAKLDFLIRDEGES